MSDCPQWRPLAMNVICKCGKRFWQHPQAVREAAIAADPFSLATFDPRRAVVECADADTLELAPRLPSEAQTWSSTNSENIPEAMTKTEKKALGRPA